MCRLFLEKDGSNDFMDADKMVIYGRINKGSTDIAENENG